MPPAWAVRAAWLAAALVQVRADGSTEVPAEVCHPECWDTDLGKADSEFNGCRWYQDDIARCAQADDLADANFNAKDLCCACCGGDPEPMSAAGKLSLEALDTIEWGFHTAAHLSFKLLMYVFFFSCGAVGFWILVFCLARFITHKFIPVLKFITPLASSYCGLIYIMYFVTIPLFGRPKKDEEKAKCCADRAIWLDPGFPHFGLVWWKSGEGQQDAQLSCSHLCGNIMRLMVNAFAIVTLPYAVLLAILCVISVMIVVPVVLVLKGVLVVIARVADFAAKETFEGGGIADEKAEEKPDIKGMAKAWLLDMLLSILMRAFTIALTFIADFLVLFSIMVNVGFMFPDLRLPAYDADLFLDLEMNMPEFLMNFGIWIKGLFAIFSMPDWTLRCQSFNTMSSLFNLFLTTYAISVVLSSDIIAVVYDRQSRLAGSAMNKKIREQNHGFFRKMFQKAKEKVTKKVVDASQYAIWQVVTVITNSVSLYIVVNMQRVRMSKGGVDREGHSTEVGDWVAADEECTWGIDILARGLSFYIAFCTACYALRVTTGYVYKDGVWILTAALVQEEKLFTKSAAVRLKAILKTALGAFFLPGVPLGLTKDHMLAIKKELYVERDAAKAKATGQDGEKVDVPPPASDAAAPDDKKVDVPPPASDAAAPDAADAVAVKVAVPEEQDELALELTTAKKSTMYYCPNCFCVATEEDMKSEVRHKKEDCVKEDMQAFFEPRKETKYDLSETGKDWFVKFTKPMEGDSTDKAAEKFVRKVLKTADRTHSKGQPHGLPDQLRGQPEQPEGQPEQPEGQPEQPEGQPKGKGRKERAKDGGKKVKNQIVDFWHKALNAMSSKEVLARALLDLAVEDKFAEKFEEPDRIKEEYIHQQDQSFDLNRLTDFRLSDFLEASIHASDLRAKAGYFSRLRHLVCMPFGVVQGPQFPAIHTSERCIIWNSQVEQVVRATGMTYSITVFALPFVGPFMGKAFQYLNEVPAWVNIDHDIKAGDYSYKQAPPENGKWCQNGSEGLQPSQWLRLLWCCSVVKFGLLLYAIFFPRQVVTAVIIVYVMACFSGLGVEKEKKIWSDRNALLGELQAKTLRAENERKEKVMQEVERRLNEQLAKVREEDEQNKQALKSKWEEEMSAKEKAELESIEQSRKPDDAAEHELKALEFMSFQRTRLDSVDGVFRQAEELADRVVALNAKLRTNTVASRKKIQDATRELGTKLKAEAEKFEENNVVVKGLVSTFMPQRSRTLSQMMQTHDEVVEGQLFASAMKDKLSQWRLFICSLDVNDINVQEMGAAIRAMIPSYNVGSMKEKVKNFQLDFNLESMKHFNVDVRKFLKGPAADVMEHEVEVVRSVIEMAVDVLREAVKLATSVQDAATKVQDCSPKAMKEVVNYVAQEAEDTVTGDGLDKAAAYAKARGVPGAKALLEKQMNPRDYSKHKFMLSKEEFESRITHNKNQSEAIFNLIKVLCSNVLVILEAVKEGCEHGYQELHEAYKSLSGRSLLEWLGVPTCCAAEQEQGEMPHEEISPVMQQPVASAEPELVDPEELEAFA